MLEPEQTFGSHAFALRGLPERGGLLRLLAGGEGLRLGDVGEPGGQELARVRVSPWVLSGWRMTCGAMLSDRFGQRTLGAGPEAGQARRTVPLTSSPSLLWRRYSVRWSSRAL